MNITLLVLNPFTNDARVHKEAKTLAANDHKVTVVALWQKGLKRHEEQYGYEIIRLNLRTRLWRGALIAPVVKYLEFGLKVWQLAGIRPAHVYHANDALTLPAAFLASVRNNANLVYDAHELETGRDFSSSYLSTVYRRLWALPERTFIHQADAVITVNESIADELVRLYRIPRPAVVMNCPEYLQLMRTDRLREELKIPARQKIVLYQGRIAKGRGIENLIKAIQSIPDVVMIALGEGPFLESYRQQARSRQWERVYLPGKVPLAELLSYSASADLGVVLTEDTCMNHHLSLPNKLFEYMHAGLPVIASDLPEIARVISTYHIGEVVKSDDPQDIAGAISRLLNDPVRHSQYRSNAEKAASRFTWERESKNLLVIYNSLEQKVLKRIDQPNSEE